LTVTNPAAAAAGTSKLALSEAPPWLRLPLGRVRFLALKSTLKPLYVGVEDLSVR
jgi:hypothetical protein